MALRRPMSSVGSRALVERPPSAVEVHGCKTVCRKCGHDVTRILRCVATGSLHPVIPDHEGERRKKFALDEATLRGLQDVIERREFGARQQLHDAESHEFSTLSMRFVSFDHVIVDRYLRSLNAIKSEELVVSSASLVSPSATDASRPVTASSATTRYLSRPRLSPIEQSAESYEFGGIISPKKGVPRSDVEVPEPRVVSRLRELGLTSSTLSTRYPVWVDEKARVDSDYDEATDARLAAEDRQRRLLVQRWRRCQEAAMLSIEVLEEERRCAIVLQQHDDFFANVLGDARREHIFTGERIRRAEMDADATIETDVILQSARVGALIVEAKERLIAEEHAARQRIEFSEQHHGRQRITERLLDAIGDMDDVRRGIEEVPDVIRLRVAVEVCQSVLKSWE